MAATARLVPRLVVVLAVVVGGTGGVGTVAAQPDPQKKAAAEAAFRQGKELIETDVPAACAAFKQSMALDPQFGTQYNLALCYDKLGRLASAWGELTELAARDTNPARRADAEKRARALEPRLVRLLIVVKERHPGLKLLRDDSDVTAFMGVATPVDPGKSVLAASAPGFRPWSLEVTLAGEGTVVTVDVPALEPAPAPPPGDGDGGGRDVFRTPVPAPPPVDRGPARRRLGLIVGGSGAVVLGVGAVFGVMAGGAFDEARELCGGDVEDCRGDTAAAADKVDRARGSALVANVAVGVGAAAVITGAVLYLTAPSSPRAVGPERATRLEPVLGPGQAGLVVRGRF